MTPYLCSQIGSKKWVWEIAMCHREIPAGHTHIYSFLCSRENQNVLFFILVSFSCILRVAFKFYLWVGPWITRDISKNVWELCFLFLFFTPWTLYINEDYPGHKSFEYEINMLSFVSVKKKKFMWYKKVSFTQSTMRLRGSYHVADECA